MDHVQWMVAVGGACAFLHSVVMGATMPAQCWGPLIGAKVVDFRTAVCIGVVFQAAGMLAFGPDTYAIFSGLLSKWDVLQPYPRVTLYSLMWIQITPIIWHSLSIWKRMLLPGQLGTVASTLGASFVFPGANHLNSGGNSLSPPFLTGVAAVFIVWVIAPLLVICTVGAFYFWNRKMIFRSEDPFHRALWSMPWHACHSSILAGLALIYAVGSPQGTTWLDTSPQGACIILTIVGSAVCILYVSFIPYMTRQMRNKLPANAAIKRMNLLGLDEATVRELTAEDGSRDIKGCVQRAYAYLFQSDMFASVSSSDSLLRIHATAEEYDKATEELFIVFQKGIAVVLTLVYGAINGHTSFGIFAMMMDISKSGEVAATSTIGIGLRCASAVGLTLGSLLFGARIVPVIGVRLVKLTPYRSYVCVFCTLQCVTILNIAGLRGSSILSNAVVAAVIAVGLVEGNLRHTNFRLEIAFFLWWCLGFGAVMVGTSVLVAQGLHTPSLMTKAGNNHTNTAGYPHHFSQHQ